MEHVKKREEISKEFTWALEDLYQDQAAWSEDLEKIRKLAQELYSCKGTLVEGAENLKKALNFYSELNQRFEKAYASGYGKWRKPEMFRAGTGADESGQ